MITREDIAEMRGVTPTKCDFCEKDTPFDRLEPEEAGAWVCWDCMARWDRKDLKDARTQIEQIRKQLDQCSCVCKYTCEAKRILAHG